MNAFTQTAVSQLKHKPYRAVCSGDFIYGIYKSLGLFLILFQFNLKHQSVNYKMNNGCSY